MSERVPRLVLMVGLPLSGKTTIAMQHPELTPVSPDTLTEVLSGKKQWLTAQSQAWSSSYVIAEAMILWGRSVVIDGELTRRGKRRPFIRIAQRHKIPVEAWYVKASPAVVRQRNDAVGSLQRHVLDRLIEEFEPPSGKESFSEIVEIDGDNLDHSTPTEDIEPEVGTGVLLPPDLRWRVQRALLCAQDVETRLAEMRTMFGVL